MVGKKEDGMSCQNVIEGLCDSERDEAKDMQARSSGNFSRWHRISDLGEAVLDPTWTGTFRRRERQSRSRSVAVADWAIQGKKTEESGRPPNELQHVGEPIDRPEDRI